MNAIEVFFAIIILLGVIVLIVLPIVLFLCHLLHKLFVSTVKRVAYPLFVHHIKSANKDNITIFSLVNTDEFDKDYDVNLYVAENAIIENKTQLGKAVSSFCVSKINKFYKKRKDYSFHDFIISEENIVRNNKNHIDLPEEFSQYSHLMYSEYGDSDKSKFYGVVNEELENEYMNTRKMIEKIQKDYDDYYKSLSHQDNADAEVKELFENRIKELQEQAEVKKNQIIEKLKIVFENQCETNKDKDNEINLKAFNKIVAKESYEFSQ